MTIPLPRLSLMIGFCVTLAGAVAALPALGSGDPPYVTAPVLRPGTIRGHVVFAGRPPPRAKLRVVSDFACCDRTPKFTENFLVGPRGGLENCVVHLLDVPSGKPMPVTTVTVDQQECIFTPHVVVAYAHTNLRLLNSDPVFHNIHGYLMRGWYSVFNIGMPTKGFETFKPLTMAGPIILKCDAGHKWMTSYVYSSENPYVARTGPDGRFVIDGIPPGRHRLKAWHESLGEADLSLEVRPSTTVEIKIEGRTDRKPWLAVVAGPTTVPTPTASAWLYPPSAAPTFTTPSPEPTGQDTAASQWATQPETGTPEGSPPSEESPGEPPDQLRTIWLVTAALAVILVFLVGLWWFQRPVKE